MNAFEVIKNIIPDGIEQCKETISKRLKLPDFDEPEPQDVISTLKTPEEWLELELLKLGLSDPVYEGEYYGSRPLMTINEFEKKVIPIITGINKRFKNYNSYSKFWNDRYYSFDTRKAFIEDAIILLDKDLLSKFDFEELRLQLNIDDGLIIKIYGSDDDPDPYKAYCSMWKNTRDIKSREKFMITLEEKWYEHVYRNNERYGTGQDVYNYKKKVVSLERNYKVQYYKLKANFEEQIAKWEKRKSDHLKLQSTRIEEINKIVDGYYQRNTEFFHFLFVEILKSSVYGFEFPKNFDIEYNSSNRLMLIEYSLPSIEYLPNIKDTKYIASKGSYKNVQLSQNELNELFDEAVYSISLRTIYEIFANDSLAVISTINFNGWIKSINRATGREENTCIISIQVQRNEFMEIELIRVDPKVCFKYLKGVGSSKLFGITAIKPILQILTKDKRFVDSHTVEFDDSTNLAAMAWEDFEHLIRELFEKEFSSTGGEVKVTQASRDGGVDAIAFDPDPIRGGKIVIQAKRYTNTVGVSAVRDLFGTVMNEGANKGILVTTSDYGSESYEFAKGKPLTLLNGANLLYLLEKHGTRARIDIREARRLMNDFQ